MSRTIRTLDGNEAAASAAYRVSQVCAIEPGAAPGTMSALASQWVCQGRTNIWGAVPQVENLPGASGAPGGIDPSRPTGPQTATFSSSQGLLPMIPQMFRLAGDLTPTVVHVAARAGDAPGRSRLGDHADVMAARTTGWAMLCSGSAQEAHDMAAIAHSATLASGVPFLHFFDGARTAVDVSKVHLLSDDDLRAMMDEHQPASHGARVLTPDQAVARAAAPQAGACFQCCGSVNPYYAALPVMIRSTMERFATLTGRRYTPFDYEGCAHPQGVIVMMGASAATARETVSFLNALGARLGVVQVRVFRPFDAQALIDTIPLSARSIAVLDRSSEPGVAGEPLYADVVTAFSEALAGGQRPFMPHISGGRYGLSSQAFTPAMAKAVFENLASPAPKNHFTVGITDDEVHQLEWDRGFSTGPVLASTH
jgi:pyruvate-ferredoxin/flavodoxin oxidoreductase